jgi:hypothetical protein
LQLAGATAFVAHLLVIAATLEVVSDSEMAAET